MGRASRCVSIYHEGGNEMKKYTFLAKLQTRLSGLPQEDIEKSLEYYAELIDDRIEDGLDEEAAVRSVGSIDEIASQILSEIPMQKLVKEKVKPQRRMRAWEIVLLSLGSPIWISLLAAAFVILLAVYIVIWSVAIVVYSVGVAFAAVAIAGVLSPVVFFAVGQVGMALAFLGAGLFSAGIAILMFYACKYTTKGLVWLSRKIWLGIKICIVGKEKKR